MKTIHSIFALGALTLSLSAFASPPDSTSNQLAVHGDTAKNLMSAMDAAGAKPFVLPGAYHLKIESVSCQKFSLRMEGLTEKCSFRQLNNDPRITTDLEAHNFVIYADQARSLSDALDAAGLTDPYVKQAKSVHCVRMVISPEYPDNTYCTIELNDNNE